MSVEIIRRKEGEMSEKQTIRHDNTQVSINNWGHLVIRFFDDTNIGGPEHLIVFDVATTIRIIDFIKKQNPSYEFIQFLKELAKSNGLPF